MRAARNPVKNENTISDISSAESRVSEGPTGGDDQVSPHSEDSSCLKNVRNAVEGQVSDGVDQGLPPTSVAAPQENDSSASELPARNTPMTAARSGELLKDEDRPSDPTSVPTPQPKLRRTSSSMSMQPTSLPKVDCQEKVFLCIDTSDEMFMNKFRAQSMSQTSVFKTLISAIKQFVHTKSYLHSKHQFSLVTLSDDNNVQLIADFNSGHENLIPVLNDIAESKIAAMKESYKNSLELDEPFDLSKLFSLIKMQSGLSASIPKHKAKYPPTNVVRVIFVYGRSRSPIKFINGQKDFLTLNSSPYFFLDCVYIHEPVRQTNCVENIFAELCSLDLKGMSHVYEVATDKNMACLYNIFAKLLAHPLQRPTQGEGSVNFNLGLD